MPKHKDPISATCDPVPHAKDPIPVANRLLLIAGRISWSGVKLIAKTAIRIPGLFVRLNTRPDTYKTPSPTRKYSGVLSGPTSTSPPIRPVSCKRSSNT